MPEASEPLFDHEQLDAYVRTVDAAEKAALGDHFGAMLTLSLALDAEPARTMSALLGWMVAGLQTMAQVNGTTIQQTAANLRAAGAR